MSSRQGARWHTGRQSPGEGAGSSTSTSAGSGKRATLGLAWTFESSKPTPATHFLQQSHTYSNKATAPDSRPHPVHSLITKHPIMSLWGPALFRPPPPPGPSVLKALSQRWNTCFLSGISESRPLTPAVNCSANALLVLTMWPLPQTRRWGSPCSHPTRETEKC